jgi:hypothetical protein
MKVGDQVIENVTASITTVEGSLLLGQSFLGRFSSWSIDNDRLALLLTPAGRSDKTIVQSTAGPGWFAVFENAVGIVYIDPTTVRIEGNLRKIWELQDYKAPLSFGRTSIRSVRRLAEYDCVEERYRTISVWGHSGPMASGDTTTDQPSGKWVYAPRQSAGSFLLTALCAK